MSSKKGIRMIVVMVKYCVEYHYGRKPLTYYWRPTTKHIVLLTNHKDYEYVKEKVKGDCRKGGGFVVCRGVVGRSA